MKTEYELLHRPTVDHARAEILGRFSTLAEAMRHAGFPAEVLAARP